MVSMNEDSGGWDGIEKGVEEVLALPAIRKTISLDHIQETPGRVVKMYRELFAGCYYDPKEVLRKGFSDQKYDEMVYVTDISFVSMCAHHWAPFMGKVHFAYIPDGKIVGLSKIPRMVEILSRRPQVQEKLTQEIADIFMEVVKPKGCGVMAEAIHLCMAIRGIRKASRTKTTALRGVFMQPLARDEFLSGVKTNGGSVWP